MKFFKIKLLAFILALVAISSCSPLDDAAENYCFATLNAPVTAVTGPTTATVNQTIIFEVKFPITNSCGSFQEFSQTSGFPKEIRVIAKYEGCDCNEVATTVTKNFEFTSATAGTFELKFKTIAGEFVTRTVTVTN